MSNTTAVLEATIQKQGQVIKQHKYEYIRLLEVAKVQNTTIKLFIDGRRGLELRKNLHWLSRHVVDTEPE